MIFAARRLPPIPGCRLFAAATLALMVGPVAALVWWAL